MTWGFARGLLNASGGTIERGVSTSQSIPPVNEINRCRMHARRRTRQVLARKEIDRIPPRLPPRRDTDVNARAGVHGVRLAQM